MAVRQNRIIQQKRMCRCGPQSVINLTYSFLLSMLCLCFLDTKAFAATAHCKYVLQDQESWVRNLDTKTKYFALLPWRQPVARPSVRQCVGSCYIESSLQGFNAMVEKHSGQQYSVDRVHFVLRHYRKRMQDLWQKPWREEPRSSLAWFLHAKFEMESQQQPQDFHIKRYERFYDHLSGGKESELIQKLPRDPTRPEEHYAVDLRLIPYKSRRDIEFENRLLQKTITHIQARIEAKMLASAQALLRDSQAPVQALRQQLERIFVAQLDKNLSPPLQERLQALSKDLQYSLLARPELWLIRWQQWADKFGELVDRFPKEFMHPELSELYRFFSELEHLSNRYQREFATGARAIFDYHYEIAMNNNSSRWQRKLGGSQPHLRLVVVRTAIAAEEWKERGAESAFQFLADHLLDGSMLSLSYRYLEEHLYKPREGGNLRVFTASARTNKGGAPKLLVESLQQNLHQESLINLLVDPASGQFSHAVVQGTHGQTRVFSGKYLLERDYLLDHLVSIEISQMVDWQLLPGKSDVTKVSP